MQPTIATQDVVVVSSWVFATWWLAFLSVHVVTCGYNAAYAFAYWRLPDTPISLSLQFYRIGMTPDHYEMIAAVHWILTSVHGVCVLLMVGSSLWLRTLAFTPWVEPNIANSNESKHISTLTVAARNNNRTGSKVNSMLQKSASVVTTQLTSRHGLLGVNGKYFHGFLTCRELVETLFQTLNAYRMSRVLPSSLLNTFYVMALVLNCWSTAIIHAFLYRNNEGRKRFACLLCDSVLDLIASLGVTLIVVLGYVGQYDPATKSFGINVWYDDEWVARALNEFQLIAIASWSDLVSRVIFSVGLILSTTNMKELLYHTSISKRRARIAVASAPMLSSATQVETKVSNGGVEIFTTAKVSPSISALTNAGNSRTDEISRFQRIWDAVMHGAHLVFLLWGLFILALHIQASAQPTLPQCPVQVRPWGASKPSCFFLCLDCHRLGITGQIDEVNATMYEFDGSTVTVMLVKHCPLLDAPDVFTEFHRLISLKVYNSTIIEWGPSAALTNTNHPEFLSIMLARVNMTDGQIPAGFLSKDLPFNLYDFEWCVTNLRKLPDDLDSTWIPGSTFILEYGQLNTVPPVLLNLIGGTYFSIGGNPISEVPPELFEIEGLTQIGIGATSIRELPRNVTRLSSTLTAIFIPDTNVSYFWEWMDQLQLQASLIGVVPSISAGGTTYCSELEGILNGSIDSFSIPYSQEYSARLMDPSQVKPGGDIWPAVDCNPSINGFTGPVYPLADEDKRYALNYFSPYP